MATLLVGFDSAWTRTNSGAPVAVPRLDNGEFQSCAHHGLWISPSSSPTIFGFTLKGKRLSRFCAGVDRSCSGTARASRLIFAAAYLCSPDLQQRSFGL